MKTCATCRHWVKRGEFETGKALDLGKCDAVPMFWNATEWNRAGTKRKVCEEFKNTKAFVQDGSDYKADLLTLPDFGCVMHEEAMP